jgi:hypothetical protein
MTRLAIRLAIASFAALWLAACGSDTGQIATISAARTIATMAAGQMTGRGTPAPAGIGMTRATLANIVTPVDLVTIETSGAQGVIAKIGTNRGVETWSSVDKKTLSFRNGIILATRGLGGDLMSAAVPARTQVTVPGTHNRRHVVLNGQDQPETLQFQCRTTAVGPDSVIVVERSYATQHYQETCSGPSGSFSNDYWAGIGGNLRKSRQWVSERVGFVVVEHLH